MAVYSLAVKKSAAREIESIEPAAVRRKIVARIRALAGTPRPAGAEKLAGSPDLLRVRQGPFRILYRIDDAELRIEIVKVGHRREVYR